MSRKKKTPDWSNAIRRAERERDRNIARIESGETFRAHQHTSRKSSNENKNA